VKFANIETFEARDWRLKRVTFTLNEKNSRRNANAYRCDKIFALSSFFFFYFRARQNPSTFRKRRRK